MERPDKDTTWVNQMGLTYLKDPEGEDKAVRRPERSAPCRWRIKLWTPKPSSVGPYYRGSCLREGGSCSVSEDWTHLL